jgi:hypothetical protein
MRLVLIAIVIAGAAAHAQPRSRGDQLIDQYSLDELRAVANELVAPLGDPLSTDEYKRIVELRTRTPALARLGAVDDADFIPIAATLCRAQSGACVDATARTLRCLADRCAVSFPEQKQAVVVSAESQCSKPKRRLPLGVGLDIGTGWQASRYPADGAVWTLGLEARLRFARRFGLVARIDRSKGRDEAIDTDGNGEDDVFTGSITRITALGGPSMVFGRRQLSGSQRYLRLDLLGGYISTRTQAHESGFAAGADLAYEIAFLRFGVRYVHGFGDARDAQMLLAHFGFLAGAPPEYDDCQQTRKSSRLVLGYEMPLFGWGFTEELGAAQPSYGIEAIWRLTRHFDIVTRADLLYFPGYERDRVIHQAVLAGFRYTHDPRDDWGFAFVAMGGYSHAAGYVPDAGTGPITNVSINYGWREDEGAVYARLHGRFGLGSENRDYRAVFLSLGAEVSFDGS